VGSMLKPPQNSSCSCMVAERPGSWRHSVSARQFSLGVHELILFLSLLANARQYSLSEQYWEWHILLMFVYAIGCL
ncbi:hypothetical protein A2U01_0073244, partial [Trifolium medium]|nr:hypothetical protein [Trifolium medium]